MLHTKTYSKRPIDKQKLVLIVTIIVSILLGVIAGYEFGDYPYKMFRNDIIEPSWLTFGLTTSGCLFIGGFINGFFKRRKTN